MGGGGTEPTVPSYSPGSNPFADRPTSRTPVGIQLAASNVRTDKTSTGSGASGSKVHCGRLSCALLCGG